MARRSISPHTRRTLLTRAERLIAEGTAPSAAARAVGIAPGTLTRWQAAPRLVPIEVVEQTAVAHDLHVTLLLPSGLRIEHVHLADLRRVLEALA